MRRMIIAALMCVTVAAGAVPARAYMAGDKNGGRGQGKGGGIKGLLRYCEELGITAEQEDRLRELSYDAQQEAIDSRAAITRAKLEYKRLMEAYDVDEATVTKAVDALSEAKREAMQTMVETQLAVRKILTAEQFEKMRKLRSAHGRGRRMDGCHGRGRGGRRMVVNRHAGTREH
jgi:Spy/CpxP family protein refolding chaperone